MSRSASLDAKIDAYLGQLRSSLVDLPPGEVNDILQEIRGHILERSQASGELTDERLVSILRALGSPDQIAPLYQADSIMARARSSLSPRVVMRGIHRWGTTSAWGLTLFVVGIIGYALGAALVLAGLGKIVAPAQVGAWVGPHTVFDIGVSNDPAAHDVLGGWLIPLGLLGGPALFVATTRALRWTLRFAKTRRPTAA
ncbi:MAG TPA: hypothetical protein VGG65_04090 [Thermoanaerobaculia bacterium]